MSQIKCALCNRFIWKIIKKDDAKLDPFLFKCLRRILKIRWPYIVSNNDILKKIVEKRLLVRKLRSRDGGGSIGRVLRMENESNIVEQH